MITKRTHAVLALTLATGPLLIASTAHAATTCGQPGEEAVYTTVHHDARDVVVGQQKVVDAPARPAVPATFVKEAYEVQPAVEAAPEVTSTELDWTPSETESPEGAGWSLTGNQLDHAAQTHERYTWERVSERTEYEWMLKVITQAGGTTVIPHDAEYRTETVPATWKDVVVPATWKDVLVPATYKDVVDVPAHTVRHDATYDESLFAYVNKQGRIRYEVDGWNVPDEHDSGWLLVTPIQHPVLSEGWDEQVAATYKTVVDVAEHTERVVDMAEHTETVVDVPEHTVQVLVRDAWEETITVLEQSHYEYVWTDSATQPPGDGWERSAAAPSVVSTTDTKVTEDDEPAPQGYELVDQETITDTPAYSEYEWTRTVVVTPATPAIPAVMGERDVMVSPAIPASAEVSHMEDLVVTTPARDRDKLVSAAVPAGPACAAATSQAASAVPATLAFTGSDTGMYLAGGLALVFAGSGLTLVARRRKD
jgi:hypothetical protein